MQEFKQNHTATISRSHADIDAGLRSYMLGIYNVMAIGLVITGFAAYAVSMLATTTDPSHAVGILKNGTMVTQFGAMLYTSPLAYVIMFLPLIAVLFLSFKIQSLSTGTARTIFFVYAAMVGLSLSSIFLVYTPGSITQTFFVAAAAFGSLSLYGYVTKRDLRPIGSFMLIGLFGIIIAMIVNLFLGSSALDFAVSVIGVLVFAGLTAYDTQNIKEMYFEGDAEDTRGRKIILGALSLYLDFINMFLFLLRFFGNRN